MKSMHHSAAQRRKASKNTSSYKPNPTGLSSRWKGEAPISLLNRFSSMYLLLEEADMVQVGDPGAYFTKSKDLLDQACNQPPHCIDNVGLNAQVCAGTEAVRASCAS